MSGKAEGMTGGAIMTREQLEDSSQLVIGSFDLTVFEKCPPPELQAKLAAARSGKKKSKGTNGRKRKWRIFSRR